MPIEKNRFTLQLLTWLLGYFGADRFYLEQTLLGLLKFITGGGFGIWYGVDLLIQIIEGFIKKPTTFIASDWTESLGVFGGPSVTFAPNSIQSGYKMSIGLLIFFGIGILIAVISGVALTIFASEKVTKEVLTPGSSKELNDEINSLNELNTELNSLNELTKALQ